MSTPKITQVKTIDLVPYERNARTHSKEQIEQLRKSIREFGFINPILVDSKNVIIAGHARCEAAELEGIAALPCIYVEHLSEAQKRAYILADNKLAMNAGWDFERKLTRFLRRRWMPPRKWRNQRTRNKNQLNQVLERLTLIRSAWITNARVVGSSSMMKIKKPECAWNLSDLATVQKNGIKVMTTFACGGGSSMGYKLAGCDVVAANDIDPEMAWHYRTNLNPKHYFLCPIHDLLTTDLPTELFGIDILDGSPPCSTFSVSGGREKDWGKEKYFREGQAKQVLSDLFFDYLDLVGKLKPKVAIAENVKGMIIGNANGYTKLIMARFRELGYKPQLTIAPQHKWITAGAATADLQELTPEEIKETAPTKTDNRFYHHTLPGDYYVTACKRMTGKRSFFNHVRLHPDRPAPTLTAHSDCQTHWSTMRKLTFRETKRLGSFPDDYLARSDKIGKYMIGMSVPPKMAEVVARAVVEQWLTKG